MNDAVLLAILAIALSALSLACNAISLWCFAEARRLRRLGRGR